MTVTTPDPSRACGHTVCLLSWRGLDQPVAPPGLQGQTAGTAGRREGGRWVGDDDDVAVTRVVVVTWLSMGGGATVSLRMWRHTTVVITNAHLEVVDHLAPLHVVVASLTAATAATPPRRAVAVASPSRRARHRRRRRRRHRRRHRRRVAPAWRRTVVVVVVVTIVVVTVVVAGVASRRRGVAPS